MNVKYPVIRNKKKEEKETINASYALFQMVACAVLWDWADWEAEDVKGYLEQCRILIDSINNGTDNWEKLADNIKENIGIDVIEELGK